ncbi:N-acetylmuramoyl-L-alanine amidase [Staphylococcus sp. 17KM0847]|uniref:N-acetylmuramoyl-L-alanine amidase n=1 Tax=Staphylococcus sp. 17KM0847 TaxID=2583989 RepID=UPI0015DD2AC2|nr:GW dipeptide domain-containing protein [Staphylococcus sp. 17KM0847]QLK85691.1 autolysin [Staphylococcus sp. 17KM0847]
MVKKIGYKTPSIIALTIAGTAITAQHADAAENVQTQETPVNVLDDTTVSQQGEVAKQQTIEGQTPISGTQTYNDPSKVDTTNNTPTETSSLQTSDVTSTDENVATASPETSEAESQQTDVTNLTEDEAPIAENDIDMHTEGEITPVTYNNTEMDTSANKMVHQEEVATTSQNNVQTVEDTATTVDNAKALEVANNPNEATPPRIGGQGSSATTATAFRSAVAPRSVTTPAYKPTVNSEINTYIRNKNYKVPTYEQDYSNHFPKYGYRNGVGKPEGIIIHDTANDSSTIDGEISYMKRNYNSAFVHGFIDGNRIIETQPTDYLAWGAGSAANQRFIHMELVHVHDYDSFARQMNNMADYVATNLQYYGLKPDSAEYDGRGTVWTHLAVSKHLGGTDHVDPHGYLNSRGYSYNELYDLILEKYQTKMGITAPAFSKTNTPTVNTSTTHTSSRPAVSKNNLTVTQDLGYGRINQTNKGLFATVYDQKGKPTNQTGHTLKVTKEANLNGKTFYLMSDAKTNALLGWVQKNDTSYQSAQPEKTLNKKYTVKPSTTVYNVPWGTKSQVIGKTSTTSNQSFKATKQQTVGNTNWLFGTVNKVTGWISANNIASTPKAPTKSSIISPLKVTNDTGMGRINTKNNGLHVSVYDQHGKKTTATNQTMRVTKKASLNGQNYYLVTDYQSGTHLGWVKQQDVKYRSSEAARNIQKTFTIPSGTNLFATPWGTSKQITGTVAGKHNQTFKAVKQQKVANTTYVYGTVNRMAGWVNQNILSVPKAVTSVSQHVSQIGQLKSTNNGLKASVYDKTSKDASRFADKTYKITKTASANNQDYVLLQNTNGKTPLGWVKADDVFKRTLGQTQKTKTQYTVNHNTSGLYAMPWGTAKQQIDTLKKVANRTFNASKSIAVGKDTFVYGNVNRKTGWINQKDLTPVKMIASQTKFTRTSMQPSTSGITLNQSNDYFVFNENGFIYAKAGDIKAIGALKKYYEDVFSVQQSKVVNGITWHYGAFQDGTKGWIKAADLRSQLVKYYAVNHSLNQSLNKQYALNPKPQIQRTAGKWENATREETRRAMDTQRIAKDPNEIYQFLKLDQYQGLNATDLDKLLKNKGILNGQGEAFREAAITHNINEIYLISHALLETGNGTSKLSNGGYVTSNDKVVTDSRKKYYNMFGVGAFDHDAVRNGFKTAESYGWDTVRKSIVGGAKFIKEKYIGAGQNTLYRMRWNPQNPAVHQYATDITWASHNAKRMKNFYDQIGEVGKYFDIDTYQK